MQIKLRELIHICPFALVSSTTHENIFARVILFEKRLLLKAKSLFFALLISKLHANLLFILFFDVNIL